MNTCICETKGFGSICLNEGTMNIENCTMRNNSELIYNTGMLKILNTIISDCGMAVENDNEVEILNTTISGGARAIRNHNKAVIKYAKFYDLSGNDGGAIYNNKKGKLIIEDTSINNNLAGINGGAIYNLGEITLDYVFLLDNKAEWNGGGIFNINGKITIKDSIICDNSAKNGGGIYNYHEGEVTLTDCVLGSNFAEFGGAIKNNCINGYFYALGRMGSYKPTLTPDSAKIIIKGCEFFDNSSRQIGGAVLNNGVVIMKSTILDYNGAARYGGAIGNCHGGEITISDTQFLNNVSRNGGAICASKGVELENCVFDNNNPDNIYKGDISYTYG